VTFVTSVNASAVSSASGDLRCFVDKDGQLVGLEQGGSAACSTSGDPVIVPTTKGYISQIQLAYTSSCPRLLLFLLVLPSLLA
jgi:hypothetical protein